MARRIHALIRELLSPEIHIHDIFTDLSTIMGCYDIDVVVVDSPATDCTSRRCINPCPIGQAGGWWGPLFDQEKCCKNILEEPVNVNHGGYKHRWNPGY